MSKETVVTKELDVPVRARVAPVDPVFTYYLIPNGDRGDLDESRIAVAYLQKQAPDLFDTTLPDPAAEICSSINLHALRDNEQIVVIARGLRGRKRSDRWKVDLKKGEADPIPHDDPSLVSEVVESAPIKLADPKFWEKSSVYGRSGRTICRSEICSAIAQAALPYALRFADNGSNRSSASRATLNPSDVPMIVYLGLV